MSDGDLLACGAGAIMLLGAAWAVWPRRSRAEAPSAANNWRRPVPPPSEATTDTPTISPAAMSSMSDVGGWHP